ncbi:pentatricopeptide repeat-containing protein At3g56550-like [Actinidia eriantha]|uniref:pentatricopeptide repeat-containing protein At3g56550-like n=1 Tax=Actinidia eriantha TaxID=165200 RepID=UPI00258FAC63|nr:pentatricopeptide repeat-containing protein At3g56550-like [Actinidia eriantha]
MSKPNCILSLLYQCTTLSMLQRIHAQVITNGYQQIPSISNQLVHLSAFSISNSLSYAQLIFSHIENPPTQAWNSMIRGFSLSSNPLEALLFYNYMVSSSYSRPNSVTFSFLLKACEKIKVERKCREVHGSIIRTGYDVDTVVCTNLIRLYVVNGLIGIAQKLFDEMPERDLVSWNSLIACYSQEGLHYEALNVWNQMRMLNIGFDGYSFVSLLSSCAHLGALNVGVGLHRSVSEKGLLGNVFVGNALIDMYAKCGNLGGALCVFNGMKKRDVSTWNSMIVGYGVHGQGDQAISFFKNMMVAGVQPNSITFLGLLCGCSHQGLVEDGIEYFHMMGSKFGLKPEIKHYGCMVDLFGRAGKLEKALEMIENSPFHDNPILWRTLLGSCKIHRNVEKAEVAMRNLVDLGTLSAGDCILLSGIYAEAKDLQGVLRVRKLIRNEGIKTTPGWSWVEVGDKIHRFVVDDNSHLDSGEIYQVLEEVIHRATLVGYTKDVKVVKPESATEECSEKFDSYHSEKLAIAFGLARTSQGTVLRIVKNLRVCIDCHSFTKFVSKAFNREIIVRDRVRFHHFKNGLCSCNDYW